MLSSKNIRRHSKKCAKYKYVNDNNMINDNKNEAENKK